MKDAAARGRGLFERTGLDRAGLVTLVVILAFLLLSPYAGSLLAPDAVFFTWPFFFEVLIGGLLAGVLYSLVALGFVLIFKSSGVFNFSQGAMVLFAALTLVGFIELGLNPVLALLATMATMVFLAFCIERVVLEPLTNQSPMVLFMSTIGITFLLTGIGQILWGSGVKLLDLGLPPQEPMFLFEGDNQILISRFELYAAFTAAVLVVLLSLFFQYTRVGRALRAVADDHQAALSVGIPLRTIWLYVWTAAGLVAIVAGIVWGTKLSVQFSLSLIALKALPVLILGGFTSIPGAIVGGLLIGSGEKISEVFFGHLIGGGIEDWFLLHVCADFSRLSPPGAVRRKNHRANITPASRLSHVL